MDLLTLIDGARKRASENQTDTMREIASDVFGTPYAEVTDDQRRYAKTLAYAYMYSPLARSENPEERFVESERIAAMVCDMHKARAQMDAYRMLYGGSLPGKASLLPTVMGLSPTGRSIHNVPREYPIVTEGYRMREQAEQATRALERLFIKDPGTQSISIEGGTVYRLVPLDMADLENRIAATLPVPAPVREDKRRKRIYQREAKKTAPSGLVAALAKRLKP